MISFIIDDQSMLEPAWCHDLQHNDIQRNNTWHIDPWFTETWRNNKNVTVTIALC